MATPLVKIESLVELAETLMDKPRRIVDELLCNMEHPSRLPMYLLYFIASKLGEFSQSASFGANYYRITPVSLSTIPTQLVDIEPEGRVRKVELVIDSISGGPAQTIRISDGAASATSGGFRVIAGQVNDLGEVPAKTRLWAASSGSVQGYVVERA